ncbi:MAG: right-handed parallel beta-helix repeat-containing protein [Lentisphaerae bacterium]|nr:right-handed parallel beta-helix repeat-containing protein [Lentisphaerota bacterium]
MKSLLIVTLTVLMATSAQAADKVIASTFGFNAENATTCLQQAIASGAKTVVVDNTGHDWIVGPITLRSDLELVFADGVVVRALPGVFHRLTEALFAAQDCRNLTLRGEGLARLVMNKSDYQDASRYKRSEWRHLITIRGCENVRIEQLTLESSGGDGIYIGSTRAMPGCKNVLINAITARDQHRQGISVISAEKLRISNSSFNGTKGTAPAAGIDFEPNSAREWLDDCVVENCEFNDNAGAGMTLYLNQLNAESRPIVVLIKNCRMTGNAQNFSVSTSELSSVKGSLRLENCRLSGARHSEMGIRNQQEGGLDIVIADCVLDCRSSNSRGLNISSGSLNDVSGIRFTNLSILPGEHPPVSFQSSSGSGLKDLQGTINVAGQPFDLAAFIAANRPDEDLKQFKVATLDIKKLRPIGDSARNALPRCRFRHRNKFLQYVPGGRDLPLLFTARDVNNAPLKIKLAVRDSNNKTIDEFVITSSPFTYVAKAPVNDVWTFDFDSGTNTISLDYAAPGQAICADSPVGIFRSANHSFYFMVPAGVKDIAIKVAPAPNEPVSAALIDPAGKTVHAVDNTAGACILKHQREDAGKDEIWRLAFPYALEDYSFCLGAPLPPLVSTAPENLLILSP